MANKKVPPDLEQLTIRMPRDLLGALKAEANEANRTLTAVAVRALRVYLADVEAAEQALRKMKP